MKDTNILQMNKRQLEAHLIQLEDELQHSRELDRKALRKNFAWVVVAAIAALCTLGASALVFLIRGEGFVGGNHIVIIAFFLVLALMIQASFVFARTERIRGAINQTQKLIKIRMASGDRE